MGNPIKFSRETFQWIKQNKYIAKTLDKINPRQDKINA